MGFAGFSAMDTKPLLGDMLGERSAYVGKGVFGCVL